MAAMHWLLENTIVAGGLALLVASVSRLSRASPAMSHLLWLTVLIRLMTPPLVDWPWPIARLVPLDRNERGGTIRNGLPPPSPATDALATHPAEADPLDSSTQPHQKTHPEARSSREAVVQAGGGPTSAMEEGGLDRRSSLDASAIWSFAFHLWLAGTLAMVILQALRFFHIRRWIGSGSPAPSWLEAQVLGLAGRLSVRPPKVSMVSNITSPLLCCLWGRTLLWPQALAMDSPSDRWRGAVIHELAHLRRRDHLVGWLDLIAGCFYWWNPLYWLVHRRVLESADQACDAWVVNMLPDQREDYAETLIEIAQMGSRRPPVSPILAVGSSGGRALKRRFVMLMERETHHRTPAWAVILSSLFLLASIPGFSQEAGPREKGHGELAGIPDGSEGTHLEEAGVLGNPVSFSSDGTWWMRPGGATYMEWIFEDFDGAALPEVLWIQIHLLVTNKVDGGRGYSTGVKVTLSRPDAPEATVFPFVWMQTTLPGAASDFSTTPVLLSGTKPDHVPGPDGLDAIGSVMIPRSAIGAGDRVKVRVERIPDFTVRDAAGTWSPHVWSLKQEDAVRISTRPATLPSGRVLIRSDQVEALERRIEDIERRLLGGPSPGAIGREPPSRHLVAAWDFEDSDGGPLADKAPAGMVDDRLTPLGSAHVADGKAIVPAATPEVGAAFRAASSADLSPTEELTIWARLRIEENPTGFISLVDKRRFRDPESRSYSLFTTPETGEATPETFGIGGEISGDGTHVMAVSSFPYESRDLLPVGEWCDAAMIVRRQGGRLLAEWLGRCVRDDADGAWQYLGSAPGPTIISAVFASDAPLLIGNNSNLKGSASGIAFEHVRLYDRALSVQELTEESGTLGAVAPDAGAQEERRPGR